MTTCDQAVCEHFFIPAGDEGAMGDESFECKKCGTRRYPEIVMASRFPYDITDNSFRLRPAKERGMVEGHTPAALSV